MCPRCNAAVDGLGPDGGGNSSPCISPGPLCEPGVSGQREHIVSRCSACRVDVQASDGGKERRIR